MLKIQLTHTCRSYFKPSRFCTKLLCSEHQSSLLISALTGKRLPRISDHFPNLLPEALPLVLLGIARGGGGSFTCSTTKLGSHCLHQLMQGVAHPGLSRCCHQSDHWPCWLGLMGLVLCGHLESPRLRIMDLTVYWKDYWKLSCLKQLFLQRKRRTKKPNKTDYCKKWDDLVIETNIFQRRNLTFSCQCKMPIIARMKTQTPIRAMAVSKTMLLGVR